MAMAIMAVLTVPPLIPSSSSTLGNRKKLTSLSISPSSLYNHHVELISLSLSATITSKKRNQHVTMASLPSSPQQTSEISTKLYVSGLSFRTTQQSLTNAFQDFGQLVEVNLVMDKIANRPRGFAFLRYSSEEESKKAIEGMHGKFLDGRVIFVEVAKPRSELHRDFKESPRRY